MKGGNAVDIISVTSFPLPSSSPGPPKISWVIWMTTKPFKLIQPFWLLKKGHRPRWLRFLKGPSLYSRGRNIDDCINAHKDMMNLSFPAYKMPSIIFADNSHGGCHARRNISVTWLMNVKVIQSWLLCW